MLLVGKILKKTSAIRLSSQYVKTPGYFFATSERCGETLGYEELHARCKLAVTVGLEFSKTQKGDLQHEHRHEGSFKRLKNRLEANQLVNVDSIETQIVAKEVQRYLNPQEEGDNETSDQIEDTIDGVVKDPYELTKARASHNSPAGTVLDFYSSPCRILRQFAKDRGIVAPTRKADVFKKLCEAYGLPYGTYSITADDLAKSLVGYSSFYMHTLKESKRVSLKIQFPSNQLADGNLPISHFAFIDDEESAEAAVALLSDSTARWELTKSLESTNPESFQAIHPRFRDLMSLEGLDLNKLSGRSIGVDVETTGLNCLLHKLRLVSIAIPNYPVLILDNYSLWKQNSEDSSFASWKLKSLIQEIFESKSITKVFFNAKFDYKFIISQLGINPSQPIVDAMLQTTLLENGMHPADRAFNLNNVVNQYMKFDFQIPHLIPWAVADDWDRDTLSLDQLVYAARDAAILPHLAVQLSPLLSKAGLLSVAQLEFQCMTAVAEMELNGFHIDKDAWEILRVECSRDVEAAGNKLRKALGWEEDGCIKNIDSPRQLLERLVELGVNVESEKQLRFDKFVYEYPKVGSESFFDKAEDKSRDQAVTAERAIGEIKDNNDVENLDDNSDIFVQTTLGPSRLDIQPITSTSAKVLKPVTAKFEAVQELLKYRQSRKLQSSFFDSLPTFINPATGRIHASYNQLGAVSGRFSCRNPNLQQMPRDAKVRACFTATPGCKLIIADFSQIELRIAADIAPDFLMIEAFVKGDDLHKLTASIVKDVPQDQVTKQDRQMAKAVNFGLIYGMSSKGLKEYANINYGVPLSDVEASMFRKKFFDCYLGIRSWHRRTEREGFGSPSDVYESESSLPFTRTRTNRRAMICGATMLQKMLNYPVQGTSADIMKQCLVSLAPCLKKIPAKLVHSIHDEIIVEVEEQAAEEAFNLVVKTMEESGQKYLKYVNSPVEAVIANTWADKA